MNIKINDFNDLPFETKKMYILLKLSLIYKQFLLSIAPRQMILLEYSFFSNKFIFVFYI